ncbi:MAG: hypothetical protein E7594_08820 [Ruminococcaceae bacterium]|nr:hypothetical protein [Oscillospiraceae bacterium]
MALIKVKIPPFCTGQACDQPCDVTVFVNNRCCLFCRSGSVAVFEAQSTCIASFLISDACMHAPLPFFEDLVITGILRPGKQYEMLQKNHVFELIEEK